MRLNTLSTYPARQGLDERVGVERVPRFLVPEQLHDRLQKGPRWHRERLRDGLRPDGRGNDREDREQEDHADDDFENVRSERHGILLARGRADCRGTIEEASWRRLAPYGRRRALGRATAAPNGVAGGRTGRGGPEEPLEAAGEVGLVDKADLGRRRLAAGRRGSARVRRRAGGHRRRRVARSRTRRRKARVSWVGPRPGPAAAAIVTGSNRCSSRRREGPRRWRVAGSRRPGAHLAPVERAPDAIGDEREPRLRLEGVVVAVEAHGGGHRPARRSASGSTGRSTAAPMRLAERPGLQVEHPLSIATGRTRPAVMDDERRQDRDHRRLGAARPAIEVVAIAPSSTGTASIRRGCGADRRVAVNRAWRTSRMPGTAGFQARTVERLVGSGCIRTIVQDRRRSAAVRSGRGLVVALLGFSFVAP